jgi:hypothetical protein
MFPIVPGFDVTPSNGLHSISRGQTIAPMRARALLFGTRRTDMTTQKYMRMTFVLAGLLISSSAHAQIFDANGKVQASVAALVCQELPRLDTVWTSQESDKLIGNFGYGFMHGYFVGRIFRFDNPSEPTPQEQAYVEHLKKSYSDFMTDTSTGVVSARVRTFCSAPENATKVITEALLTWLLKINKITDGCNKQMLAFGRRWWVCVVFSSGSCEASHVPKHRVEESLIAERLRRDGERADASVEHVPDVCSMIVRAACHQHSAKMPTGRITVVHVHNLGCRPVHKARVQLADRAHGLNSGAGV